MGTSDAEPTRRPSHDLRFVLPADVLKLIVAETAEEVMRRLQAEAGTGADAWLNSREAAAHLGISLAALHKHTSARTIPFEQSAPNGRCWFQRSALDAWRRGRPTARSSDHGRAK